MAAPNLNGRLHLTCFHQKPPASFTQFHTKFFCQNEPELANEPDFTNEPERVNWIITKETFSLSITEL